MNWQALATRFEGFRRRGTIVQRRGRALRRRLALLLAVVGPGLITSNVNNEAGGIYTYSLAGAQFGYAVLWLLIPMAIILYVSEEMVARMGAITGKGLSDLIREEFGFRITFFVMLAVLVGGTTFGFVGMVLAVPATAALSVFWKDLKERYLGSAFYRGEPPPLPPGAPPLA